MNAPFLFLRYAAISVRSQMQYRASFVMQSIGQFVLTIIEFLSIWVLFDRFGSLDGWTLAEIAFFYGMINTAWSIADMFSRGFDTFGDMVKGGDFDRLLLRPRTAALQVAASQVAMRRIGRLLQGLVILFWAAHALRLAWTPASALLALAAILGGACLFFGLIVVQATFAFWTTEGLEIMNTVTYGGVQTMQYPLSVYRPWFRRFFTFVVPLACVNYFPTVAILRHSDPLGTPVWLQWVAPVFGLAFLVVSLQVWKIGVRHYCSTGS